MRKIEQRMVNAINNKVNYRESNTEVIIKGANVFVRLYDTYIYAKVRGKVYFSDGGFNTATTRSRFHIDFNNCKYRVDGTNELLIINDSFLKDTIILDIHQIMFIETNFKH